MLPLAYLLRYPPQLRAVNCGYASGGALEVSGVWTAVCQSQSVACLRALHVTGASSGEESAGDYAVSGICEVGPAVWSGAGDAGEDAHRVSGADELCRCQSAA